MNDKIPWMQFVQFFQGNGLPLRFPAFEFKPVVTFKDLMVRVTAKPEIMVHKPFMKGKKNGSKRDVCFLIAENGLQPFNLFLLTGKDEIFVTAGLVLAHVFTQKVEIFVENRLAGI